MPAVTRLLKTAVALVGPAVVEAVARAARDPRARRQMVDILMAARLSVGQAMPAARSRARLRQDLDATVTLARSRWESARDDDERTVALEWLREAQDIRRAADIVDNLPSTERRTVTERLDSRRLTLLRRMLTSTLADAEAAAEGSTPEGRAGSGAPDALPDASSDGPTTGPPGDTTT